MAGGGEGAASAGPVRPPIALAFATVGFIALTIFGLGITSLVLAEDVIATPGLGQIPGAAGVVCATLAFAGGLWAAIARAGSPSSRASAGSPHPSYWGAAWTTAAAFLAYIGGVWLAALFTGADLGVATAVAGRLATSWFGVSVGAAAFVSAWAGIALVRTRAHRPRWPWEDEFDE
ncbi:hypothetical protein MRBLMI12_002640 [Microbacterium sp. LMI12-1-1.1]|uniref:hypothetical protein n=1 Tax=Microbacterium sp. LMI12-1-1.1 TaxID=3135225 RepID=UPI0034285FA8